MQPAVRPRTILLPRRALLVFLTFLFAAFLTLPAVAEYLGPDRTTTVFVEVRDPDHDVWTLTHVDPFDGLADVCLIIHSCAEHPSVERQQALCGWVADNSGCDEAFKIEEKTVLLPEATIAGVLHNCSLVDGWCTSSPTLHLSAVEPVAGESISLIEGTRNGEPFACSGAGCDVPLLEGTNEFSFWALSTWGDSSQMGTFSALVDSLGPTMSIPDSWYIWEPLAIGVEDGEIGVDRVKLTIDGGSFGNRVYEWTLGNLPSDFIWDRHFGEVIAPIGEYPVSVKAWDLLGNSTSASGLILIPAPEEPELAEEVSAPLNEPSPTDAPEPTAAPIASGLSVQPTSTSEPLAALVEVPAASIGSAEPATTTTSAEGGSGTLLWGAAALAAAASATAYALNRRKARQEQIEKMRHEAAEAASPEAQKSRLSRLWDAAIQRVAPLRAVVLAAAAAAARARELAARSEGMTSEEGIDELRTQAEQDSAQFAEAGELPTGQLDQEPIAEMPVSSQVDTGSPSSELAPLPGWLLERLPSFNFTAHSIREPIVRLPLIEAGAYESYRPGVELSPVVGMTPDTFTVNLGRWRLQGGWEGNRAGLMISTPSTTETFGGGDATFTRRQTGSVGITWNGWNTSADVQYSPLNFAVDTQGTVGYSGRGAQGVYVENRPVQGLVTIGGVVVVIVAGYFLGPEAVRVVQQWGQQLPILNPIPGG